MKLTTEPSIPTKIQAMQTRVRWQHAQIQDQEIDQTGLVLADGGSQDEEFSFLVLGDSGTGRHRRSSPQRQVAENLFAVGETARFVLHTGDVVYLLGSSEQYLENFIKPYRELLVGGEYPRQLRYDRLVFKRPFLPVPGNHDYYDIPYLLGLLSGLTWPLRYVLRSYIDLDVGWHGSFQGDAYARAFMDYLRGVPEAKLADHLATHYCSDTASGRCLTYRPGAFTRIPNRYYTFRYGGIDFFALDSNTFNQPLPLPDTPEGRLRRDAYAKRRQQLVTERADLLSTSVGWSFGDEETGDRIEDIAGDIEQIDEQIADLDKQLSEAEAAVDEEQLTWLRDRLIASWRDPEVRGRILFFHHPPYVTEASKWPQGQTLAVRYQLRQVLDAVQTEVGAQVGERSLVDAVFCGHAHCLEYLHSGETGHGDRQIPWLICGGSGYSLRRQRPEGSELMESTGLEERPVARSKLFVGRTGRGKTLKRPYSGLRVEVQAGNPPGLRVTPVIAEKAAGEWHRYCLEPFTLNP